MNIAFLTSRYPSKNNPYNHMFVHMRCAEMVKQGYDVKVYVPAREVGSYIFEGIEVLETSSSEISKELHKYDVLYLHLLNIYPFTKENGWPIYKFIMKNNLPYVMYIHGNDVQKYGARMFEFRFTPTELLKWFKRDNITVPLIRRFVLITKNKKNASFIFPSKWMKDNTEENLKLRITKNYHIIPNGIDTKLFEFRNLYTNRFKLLTLRPLSSRKYAVDVAIDIMEYLPVEFSLEIYGKGHYEKAYRKKIRDLGLEDRVFIKNKFIERRNLNNFFSKYGGFLAPTRMDAQGVSMCEAMASGLLTVSSDNTAIPEFITHLKTGIIGNNPEEIASNIANTFQSLEKYSRLANNARKAMEKIDIAKTVSRELMVLKEVTLTNGK